MLDPEGHLGAFRIVADGALVALPVFATLPDGRLAAIGITGDLKNTYTISLRTPSPVPSITMQPLTVLPGEALPLSRPPG